MFGSSQPQKPSLFGSTLNTGTQPAQQQSGGLFGSTQSGGLFGTSTQQQPQQQQSTGLFGLTAQRPQGSSLFAGAGSSQPLGGGGLFVTSQQQPQQQASTGMFGGSLFNQSQQQQQPATLGGSTFRGSTNTLGQSAWQPTASTREKSIREQMDMMYKKWDPRMSESVFQTYFYQDVGERAPYYGPGPDEDHRKWEEALDKKPTPTCVPVLARGFAQGGIAERLVTQSNTAGQLNIKCHEIHDRLKAKLEEHDLKFTVRTQEAKRKHATLSRRCLALATRAQVLRNRGYTLDSSEEDLKNKLAKLETTIFDPVLSGRQEEIWARMTVVRERAQMLKEETEKLGQQAGYMESGAFSEENMAMVKKLLEDYDSQLAHLRKELGMITQDFTEWEASTKPTTTSTAR